MAYKADYHVHTRFSLDSHTPMKRMIEKGISLNLNEICFTEHMEFDYPGKYVFEVNYDHYVPKVNQYRDKYKDKILIKCGVEVGLQPDVLNKVQSFVDTYPFDYVIGSVHVIGKLDPYTGEYFIGKTQKQAYEGYFNEILDVIKSCHHFNCLGHLDYVIRYHPSDKKDYTYDDYRELIDEILKTLIANNKGIEVNSSGIRKGLNQPHPQYNVIKRYKELGGQIITTGSDAHRTSELCSDFSTVYDYLKHIGFDYVTTFSRGTPIFKKI